MRSQRLEQLPPYLFVEIDKLREYHRARGRQLLDLGIGDPDLGAPPELTAALAASLTNPKHDRYPPNRGLVVLIDAVRSWALRVHGAALEREEVLVTIGSKEAIGHLPLAVVNPGERVIIPDPGYPVYLSSAVFAGAACVRVPLEEDRGYRPALESLAPGDVEGARLLMLNYPNNPTSATADRDLFGEAIEFSRRRGIILANDAAYSEVYYETQTEALFPRAREAGISFIEFFSFSKTFSITGWRVGFAIGSREVIAALEQLKNNLDSGVYGAIQEAVAVTMERHYDAILARSRAEYGARRDLLAASLERAGFSFALPKASFYFWVRTPAGIGSMDFCRGLIEDLGIVATPGVGFGALGEGHVRFSLTADRETIRQAGERLIARASAHGVA
jgi:LL-diaminopimelate aminotransferase